MGTDVDLTRRLLSNYIRTQEEVGEVLDGMSFWLLGT